MSRTLLSPSAGQRHTYGSRDCYHPCVSIDSLSPGILTLAGVLLGAFTTYVVSARQVRSSERVARAQIESQQQLAREQSLSQIELERERHRRERLEEAYSQLMMWCADLDRLINDVEDAFFTSDQKKIEIAYEYAKDWPFSVIKEPKGVAGFRHYWSEEIYMLLRSSEENHSVSHRPPIESSMRESLEWI